MEEEHDDRSSHVWQFEGYSLDQGNFATALVHLYRGEVSRTNLWRSRLDTTTNWAVVTTGAALTFIFTSPENPHFVLLLVLLLVFTFLWIEARRYSYYALWYHRARLLETDFFAAMIAPPFRPRDGWAETLSRTLMDPSFLLPRWRTVAIRYRRNYVWLVSLLVVSWVLKLNVHPTLATDLQDMVDRAAIGSLVPGAYVVSFLIVLYVGLLGLALASRVLNMRGDDAFGPPQRFRRGLLEAKVAAGEQLAIIVTQQRDAVSQAVMDAIHRGVTALEGTGMHTGESRNVLFCALKEDQTEKMRQAVEDADPRAFVVLTGARDIRGRGFAPSEPPS